MIDQILIDTVVGVEGVEQHHWNFAQKRRFNGDRIDRVGSLRHLELADDLARIQNVAQSVRSCKGYVYTEVRLAISLNCPIAIAIPKKERTIGENLSEAGSARQILARI